MARAYRLQAEDCFYHITSRGNDRKQIYASDYDYRKFLEYVLTAKKRFDFYLYAYVLMPNHYHLLIKTRHANLSKIMHNINSSYTTYYNIKHNKTGHLFQGRYKSIVVDADSYFSTLTKYIHLNPVKAKMVELPEEYNWSSYKGYIEYRPDSYIDKDQVDKVLGIKAKEYRQFVIERIGEKEENPFKGVYGGFILGNASFIKDKLSALKEQVGNKDISHKRALRKYVSAEDINDLMKREYGQGFAELTKKRTRGIKDKKIAIYLLRRLAGLSNAEIGGLLGMNFSAVSKSALDIERAMANSKILQKEVNSLISKFEG